MVHMRMKLSNSPVFILSLLLTAFAVSQADAAISFTDSYGLAVQSPYKLEPGETFRFGLLGAHGEVELSLEGVRGVEPPEISVDDSGKHYISVPAEGAFAGAWILHAEDEFENTGSAELFISPLIQAGSMRVGSVTPTIFTVHGLEVGAVPEVTLESADDRVDAITYTVSAAIDEPVNGNPATIELIIDWDRDWDAPFTVTLNVYDPEGGHANLVGLECSEPVLLHGSIFDGSRDQQPMAGATVRTMYAVDSAGDPLHAITDEGGRFEMLYEPPLDGIERLIVVATGMELYAYRAENCTGSGGCLILMNRSEVELEVEVSGGIAGDTLSASVFSEDPWFPTPAGQVAFEVEDSERAEALAVPVPDAAIYQRLVVEGRGYVTLTELGSDGAGFDLSGDPIAPVQVQIEPTTPAVEELTASWSEAGDVDWRAVVIPNERTGEALITVTQDGDQLFTSDPIAYDDEDEQVEFEDALFVDDFDHDLLIRIEVKNDAGLVVTRELVVEPGEQAELDEPDVDEPDDEEPADDASGDHDGSDSSDEGGDSGDEPAPKSGDDGCGCAAAPSSSDSGLAMLVIAALAVVRRRRATRASL